MNHPTLANESTDISLSSDELADLTAVCQRTLASHPALASSICPVELKNGVNVPFLPIRCFRLVDVCGYPRKQWDTLNMRIFRSSGSTQAQRATHALSPSGWRAYEQASVRGFQDAALRLGIPKGCPVISLVPPRSVWPESSLAAMVEFWKHSGIDVYFVDVESDPGNLNAFLQLQAGNRRFDSFVLFATSLHYLAVAQWHASSNAHRPFLDAQRIWFFDTGGTKGRTLSVRTETLHQHMKAWATAGTEIHLLSEYGMCELASQAYTLHSPHAGIFSCTPTLHALAIDADLRHTRPIGETGFLGFIDQANTDSWPFIITEDLGARLDQRGRTFQLSGRSPDASIKGCSLNVKSNFQHTLTAVAEHAEATTLRTAADDVECSARLGTDTPERQLFTPEALLSALQGECWTSGFRDDLSASLQHWNDTGCERTLSSTASLGEETIAVVASANISITWLFPATHAWLMGAKRLEVYLPSVRPEDPLSKLVRAQIQTLATAFNACLGHDFIAIRGNRLPAESDADRIIVFGHDETIASIKAQTSKSQRPAQVIGLGHFQNTWQLNHTESPELLATHCARWLGRGCLTPLVASIPASYSDDECSTFAKRWLTSTIQNFESKLQQSTERDHRDSLRFAHRHNLAELRAIIKSHKLPIEVLENPGAAVVCVNLAQTPAVLIERTGLASKLMDWGGSGWLTLVSSTQLPESWQTLCRENPMPQLWDSHQGRTWREWLSEH